MGMTIDEVRTALGKERKYALHENKQAFDMAISIMRKYQKIQEIARWNNAPSPYYKPDGELFREIVEVIGDGNDDNKV